MVQEDSDLQRTPQLLRLLQCAAKAVRPTLPLQGYIGPQVSHGHPCQQLGGPRGRGRRIIGVGQAHLGHGGSYLITDDDLRHGRWPGPRCAAPHGGRYGDGLPEPRSGVEMLRLGADDGQAAVGIERGIRPVALVLDLEVVPGEAELGGDVAAGERKPRKGRNEGLIDACARARRCHQVRKLA